MQTLGQRTLAKSVTLTGKGLHTGQDVTLTIKPADGFSGISFLRTDETAGANAILVTAEAVVHTPLCTRVKNDHNVSVDTTEHLMATLHALGVDNAVIELNGPELPIMDGSALPFVEHVEKVGTMCQDDRRKSIKVLKSITVKEEDKTATVAPCETFFLTISTDYNHPLLPRQTFEWEMNADTFRTDLAPARTFCFEKDVKAMQANGLALGGSLENAVVIGENGILNKEPLRFDNECIRHKALDCIGDFYMAGYPILGHFTLEKPGHALNNTLLRTLLADTTAWEWV